MIDLAHSVDAHSLHYLALTPRGKITVLDALQIAAGGEGGLAAQVRSLVGPDVATTFLDSIYGPVAAMHEHDAHTATDLDDNPAARMIFTVLGEPDRRRGGVHVFCGVAENGTATGLSDDQIHLLHSAADRARLR